MDDDRWMDGEVEPRGVKRPAEDDLQNEQRLSKRLSLLNLGQNGRIYAPVTASLPDFKNKIPGADDVMQLDDTKDKVYIYNLDDELSESDVQGDGLIFLPDIERRLTKIPDSILTNAKSTSNSCEVVLYSVPSSLSIPKEQDSVRKAIIESRARMRELQTQEVKGVESIVPKGIHGNGSRFGSHGNGMCGSNSSRHFAGVMVNGSIPKPYPIPVQTSEDPDAMEIE